MMETTATRSGRSLDVVIQEIRGHMVRLGYRYRQGANLAAKLPLLAAYMGHRSRNYPLSGCLKSWAKPQAVCCTLQHLS